MICVSPLQYVIDSQNPPFLLLPRLVSIYHISKSVHLFFFFESKTKIPRQWFLFIYVYVYLHVFINTCYETCILASKSFIVQNLEYYMYFEVFGVPNIHKLPTNHIVKYSHMIFFPFCNCDRRWKNIL